MTALLSFSIAASMFSSVPATGTSEDDRWIRPDTADSPLFWGRPDGLVFGLPSEGGMPGPRGLVRIGIWNRETGRAELVNFVAVEPVTNGFGRRHKRMAFSELEPSDYDAPERGKRLWVEGGVSGELAPLPTGVKQLSVRIEVEPFASNGAHVYLVARMRSDLPNEVAFSVHHHDGSVPIEELTLTATMGNYERLRLLWLKDRVIDSRELYKGYNGVDFAEEENYPLDDMQIVGEGVAFVMCSSDESDPAAVELDHRWWRYKSRKLTQYWRVPKEDVLLDLRVRVNGRRVYWGGELEIPGGLSFENFELRQNYEPGQRFIFGLTEQEPWELIPTVSRFAPDHVDADSPR